MSEKSNEVSGIENPKEFSQNVLQALVKCIKLSAVIPNSGSEYAYYNTFKGFQFLMQKEKDSVVEIMKSLIQGQHTRALFEKGDVGDKFDILLDLNASMYENIGAQIDEVTCPKKGSEDLILATKNMTNINTSWNLMRNKKKLKTAHTTYSLLSSKNIQRPQLTFKEKVDNSNNPFVPKLKEKPHALKPLAILVEKNEYDEEEYSHPYEWELQQLRYPKKQLHSSEPIIPKLLEETPLIMVVDEEGLNEMMEDLKMRNEIAIDIENHSFRSFQGFSCLIQISTREKDYIVDAIKLRSKLDILNEVTANPKIVKVLHGADMDVLWLQRDFGVYIVNLFDTGQAARTLSKFGIGFSHFSLAYLMKHYCNLDVDKQFQLADWRIRPLPDPLIKYAREDTHYLLYIYDCIKKDLLEYGNGLSKDLLQMALDSSKELCLKKYKKLLFDDERWLELCHKSPKILDERQKICVKELYQWRDHLAREDDESYGFILPNHMLLKIAEVMPKDHQGIIACCNPVPPLVSRQLNELYRIITKARTSPVNKLTSGTDGTLNIQETNRPTVVNNTLNSLHDFYRQTEGKASKFQHLALDNLNMDDLKSSIIPFKKTTDLQLKPHVKGKKKEDSYANSARKVAKSIDDENKTPFVRFQLTQEYYNLNKPKEGETIQGSNKDTLNKNFIETVNSPLNSPHGSTTGVTPNNSRLDTSSDQVDESSLNTSNNTSATTENASSDSEFPPSIRKKKKRKKLDRGVVDIPFEQRKKAKVNEATIKPFNYAEAEIDKLITNVRNAQESFRKDINKKQQKFNKFKKGKHAGKQFTGKTSESQKNWPKN